MPRPRYDDKFLTSPIPFADVTKLHPDDRVTDPAGAQARAERLENFVRELTTKEDIEGIMTVLRDARQAITTVRCPRTEVDVMQRLQNDYAWVPDHGIRLAAARLHISYIASLPAQRATLEIQGPGGPTPEEQVAALKAAGTDLPAIIETWLGAAKAVSADLRSAGQASAADEIDANAKRIESHKVVDV